MVEYSRKVGYLERVFLCRNVEGLYPNFNVTAKLNIRFDSNQLSNALSALVKNHSILTYNCYKTSEEDNAISGYLDWDVITVRRIKFDDVVSFETIENFDKEIIEKVSSLTCPVNVENLPLWRIKVFETRSGDQYLCVYFDHILYDGLTGVDFHKELCKELSALSDVKPMEYIFDRERDQDYLPNKLPPATEEYSIYKPTVSELIGFKLAQIFPLVVKYFGYVASLFNPMKPNFDANPLFNTGKIVRSPDSKFLILNLNPFQIEKILHFCRIHGLTLTPYIQTLTLECLEDLVLSRYEKGKKFSTQTTTAIDVRKFLPPGDFQYGCLATVQYFDTPPILDRTRAIMKQIQSSLHKTIKNKTESVVHYIGMFRYLNYSQFYPIIKKDFRHTLLISNVGRVEELQTTYKINDIYFSQGVTLRYYFGVCLASSKHGGLNAVISYLPEFDDLYEGDRKLMDVFAEKLKERLLNFTTEEFIAY